ncbi:hypothetical protein AVDCRST_MAG84-3505 [uncultured Microcoleus sp.]|uniref:Uncharacterized protein n=1 Tax=uncultured Microcoleus sp. TaxID=259945 RepID=A0A6J4MJ63_9CYAN|nr:hypothetical protein AVDCRST_MAG84-3505 [uncultured Microcoleus sp.]
MGRKFGNAQCKGLNRFNGWMFTEDGRKKEEGRRNFLNFKIASFRGMLRGFNLNSKLTIQNYPHVLTNSQI